MAVTVAALEAQAASPGNRVTPWGAVAAALIAAAGVLGVAERVDHAARISLENGRGGPDAVRPTRVAPTVRQDAI